MFRAFLVASATIFLAAGCGGGGKVPVPTQGPGPPAPQASPGGIWQGTSSLGFEVVGLASESGQFHFIQGDGTQLVGTLSTSDDELSANFVGYVPFGEKFDDGSTTGVGSLSGNLHERSSISASVSFTTSRGAASQSTIALSYDRIYERNSSLESVAGNYLDTERNVVMNVNDDGEFFSQDPRSQCITNGTVSLIDSEFNLYRVEYTFSNCKGHHQEALNGKVAEGLATLDDTQTPEALIMGVEIAAAGYAFAGVFPRS